MTPWLLSASLALAAGIDPVKEAERLASASAQAKPEEGLALAQKALALTADFEPTAFVRAGRKGEVVEDAYLEARAEYRRHRARLYEAVGQCLARKGEHAAARRYLGRAVSLHAQPSRAAQYARALVTSGRGLDALDVLRRQAAQAESLSPEGLAVLQEAVDAAGLPSAQVELDRARLQALAARGVEARDGPFGLPPSTRLSSGTVLRLDEALTALYVAELSCRSCSEDLQTLRRLLTASTRVAVVPEDPDADHALRQVLGLYRIPWPLVLGKGVSIALGAKPRGLLVVARSGWAAAVVAPPFAALPSVLKVFARVDVQESVPRPSWNRRPLERGAPAPPPGLLPEGLAPGEDEPAPEAFSAAVAAYRAGRASEALRLFESIGAQGDGWLLPPEARLNRALCLGKLGQRDAARRLLLRTGDSRFQQAVDRALETIGAH